MAPEISKPSISICDAIQGSNSSTFPVKILITPAGTSLVASTSAKLIAGIASASGATITAEFPLAITDINESINSRKFGFEITPKEVVKYIAYNINNNVRELEGALISLLAQSSLNRKEIDLDLAKKVLRNFVKSSSKEITIDTIQKMVCEYFDVPYDKLLQKTRKREIVQARQITMYLAKAFTKNSLKTIGEHFGGRDHTTVIHSCQTVKDLMDTDGIFRENVLELQQKVQLAAM